MKIEINQRSKKAYVAIQCFEDVFKAVEYIKDFQIKNIFIVFKTTNEDVKDIASYFFAKKGFKIKEIKKTKNPAFKD